MLGSSWLGLIKIASYSSSVAYSYVSLSGGDLCLPDLLNVGGGYSDLRAVWDCMWCSGASLVVASLSAAFSSSWLNLSFFEILDLDL